MISCVALRENPQEEFFDTVSNEFQYINLLQLSVASFLFSFFILIVAFLIFEFFFRILKSRR